MLEILIASVPRRQADPAAFFGATLLHATLLSLGIFTTGVTVTAVARAVDDTTLIYLPRLDPLRTPQAPRPRIPGGGGSGGGGGLVISLDPPPLGFQVIELVTSIPGSLPGAEASSRPFDPRDYTGRGVEGGTGWGIVGGTGSPDQAAPPEGTEGLVYAASLIDDRFTAAELVVPPHLVYPRPLEAAGVPGRATLQFIIDTTGQVEPPSVQVLDATHEAFGVAAREGILAARFTPARFGGRPVRQLSRLPVRFTVPTGAG